VRGAGGCRRLLLLACVASGPALASDSGLLDLPFEDLLQVEIRSAGKREEQIRDIPASVTIVSREEIARYGWTTLEELLRNVPGFFLLDNTEERFIGTRGAVGGGVQFLVNGIAQHPSLQKTITVPEIARLNIPIEAVDRVEIIRGPMSVVYGNNAFLGVVNVVTNDIAANGPRVSASLGNRGTGAVFARAGRANRDGFFAINLGARRDDGLAGDYADMMYPADFAALDPAMHRDMDGDMEQQEFSLDLSAGWRDFSADLRWSRRDYGVFALTPAFDDGNRIRLDTLHASLGWQHQFSDQLGLRVTGTYSREDYDIDRFDLLAPEIDGYQEQGSRRTELEADLLWRPHRDVDALVGYRLLHIADVRNRAELGLPGGPPLINADNSLGDYSIHGLFGEIGWQVNQRWRLVAGGRLTRLPSAYKLEQIDVTTGAVAVERLAPEDRLEPNARLALLWNPSREQVVKLIWGTASQDSGERPFAEPERIQTLELNATWTRSDWLLSGSLFQNRIDNIARSIQRFEGDKYVSVADNSGRWRTRGLELILEARPLSRLDVAASLTWQQTEDQRSDLDPGYSPELLAKLRANWRYGPFTYAAFAHYVDGMEADWDFEDGPVQGEVMRIGDRVPAYWNLGLNLRWDPAGVGPYANLNVSNLLDEEIRYPANELTDALDRGLIGPGRTLTATVGYQF
jgi:outer membrane receptor protein involved in Fe transport